MTGLAGSLASFGAIVCNLTAGGFAAAAWIQERDGERAAAALRVRPPSSVEQRFVQVCEVGGLWRRSLSLLWIAFFLMMTANTLNIWGTS